MLSRPTVLASVAFHLLVGLGLLSAGCAKSDTAIAEPKGDAKPPEATRGLLTESGEATQRSAEGDRPILWRIQWRAATLTLVGDKPTTSHLRDVQGDLFRDGKQVSEFSAETGEADGEADTLSLEGKVTLVETVQKATLTCDRAVYYGKTGMVRAQGDVKINYAGFTIGPMREAWATAELDRAGTPDTFNP